eukprot:2574500-Heterocapsa_arctica.AAC.1
MPRPRPKPKRTTAGTSIAAASPLRFNHRQAFREAGRTRTARRGPRAGAVDAGLVVVASGTPGWSMPGVAGSTSGRNPA